MSNLLEIQSQIEKLQKQAADIRSKEFHATVLDIRAKMQAFGITVKDLQTAKPGKVIKVKTGKPGRVKLAKGPKKPTNPVAAKFRGPNGETWSGRGLTPRWLATLIAQGQPKEAFAINA